MNFFIIKRTFILKYKKKVAVSGTIKNDINKPISEFNKLLINNVEVPIEEVNEVLIDHNSFIAFTFKLNSFDESLLLDIIKLKEGTEVEII